MHGIRSCISEHSHSTQRCQSMPWKRLIFIVAIAFFALISSSSYAGWEDKVVGRVFPINKNMGPDKGLVICPFFKVKSFGKISLEGSGPPGRSFEAICTGSKGMSVIINGKLNGNVLNGKWRDTSFNRGDVSIMFSIVDDKVWSVMFTFISSDGEKRETMGYVGKSDIH